MVGFVFLVVCLGCDWIGMTGLSRYERSLSCDPYGIWESITGFLGAALNLVAAAVSFCS
jgi:hypothetical protein